MKKKIIALVIALCLCIGILASCSLGKGNNKADNTKTELLNDFNVFGANGDNTKDNFAYTTATEITLPEGVELVDDWIDYIYRFPIQKVRKLVDGHYKYGVYSFETCTVVIDTIYNDEDDIEINNGFVITSLTENPGEETEKTTYTLFDRTFTKFLESVDEEIDFDINQLGNSELAVVVVDNKITYYNVGTDGKLTVKETYDTTPQTGSTIGANSFFNMNLELIYGKEFKGYTFTTVNDVYYVYKNGNLVGTIDLAPYNITDDPMPGDNMIISIDNKLVFQTVDPVDRNAKYTYSDGATRFLVRTFIVDIKSAKISEVNTTALISSRVMAVSSKDGSKSIAYIVSAQKVNNYILENEQLFLLTSDGSVSNNALNAIDFNDNIIKLKDNRYLVYQLNPIGNPQDYMLIVDSKLNIISNLSGMRVVDARNGYITLRINGNEYIIIDADGKVVIGQDKGYTWLGSVLNGKALAVKPHDDDPTKFDAGILDVNTATFTKIEFNETTEDFNSDDGIESFFYLITRDNTETAGPADGVTDIYTILNGGTKLGTLEAGDWITDFEYTPNFAIIRTFNGHIFKLTTAA